MFKLTLEGRAGEAPNVDYSNGDPMIWWQWMWPVRDDDERIIGIVQGCQAHDTPIAGAAGLRLIERP